MQIVVILPFDQARGKEFLLREGKTICFEKEIVEVEKSVVLFFLTNSRLFQTLPKFDSKFELQSWTVKLETQNYSV